MLGLILLAVLALSSVQAQTGAYTLNGGTAVQTSQTYAGTLADQSAVYVLNAGNLTLTNCTITKTGDASSTDNSSQYGTNAGVLAKSAGTVTISGGTVTTNASGGNGIFASGTGSSISMSDGTISALGGNAHGVDVTYGGAISLTNVDVTTKGASSSAIATDFGGGTVTVRGGTISASATSSGSHSAGIYSTGMITVSGATVTSLGDCGGVIDGGNSILLTNTALTGAQSGIKIWKTAPMTGTALVTINGGSLTAAGGDAFYVTGTTGNAAAAILMATGSAKITASSGCIVNVDSKSTAAFAASGESLVGNLFADATSTVTATLQENTTIEGSMQRIALTLDSSSVWTVTENSILTALIDPRGVLGTAITNIIGNGHNVHYDADLTANLYLGGLTYSLVNGGVLTPGSVDAVTQTQSAIPTECVLHQNYPNPFNPSTTIAFSLTVDSRTTLTVYDCAGRQVATPVNATLAAGNHQYAFDGSQLTSGVYFCRLTASPVSDASARAFTDVKKFTLLK